jgi:hypothetical protein
LGRVHFFFEFILEVLKNYRGLFSGGDEQDIEESEPTFEMKWSWFIILEMVADTLKISVEQVQEIGVIEFLNWWAYNKEKQDDLRIKMKLNESRN